MNALNTPPLKELVHSASKAIAHYWPMTTFVHHNPIRSLETLPFHDAVRVANRLIGGRGYLPNTMYRKLVASGRIETQHLDAALRTIASDKEITIGSQNIRHIDVLRAHLLQGITPPPNETIFAFVDHQPNNTAIRALAKKLSNVATPTQATHTIGQGMTLATWCDNTLATQLNWQIDREVIKWCESFLDEGHATWPMPGREQGFYQAWKALASKEWSPCGITNSAKKIHALPTSPEEALHEHLDALAIPPELQQDYLSLQLTALYGWASFINWRSEHDDYPWQVAYPIDLVQYLAVRLFYERELVEQTCQTQLNLPGNYNTIVAHHNNQTEDSPNALESTHLGAAWQLTQLTEAINLPQKDIEATSTDTLQQLLDWLNNFPEADHGPVWLDAYESGYNNTLIKKLKTSAFKADVDSPSTNRPSAQLMFCIDVRSEPFRRNLESVGPYETIGFAGFFGLAIRSRAQGQHHETDQCPAIVAPKYTVHEVVREGQNEQYADYTAHQKFTHMLHSILYGLKSHVLTPYILVEALGWFFGIQLVERTFFPGVYRKWRNTFKKATVPTISTQITADADNTGLGLPEDDQSASIETALRTIGLTTNFGRLVIVAGHTSMSDNNPYEAALNCGACGGNSGEPNARLFAALANKPTVREHLANNGITIPDDTYFIGAVHNTTTDALDLYDLEDLPATHKEDVTQLKVDLKKAAEKNNLERCYQLPGAGHHLSPASAVQEICRRSADWSETRPEWGLSGNASFIIGNRKLTQALNLEGRAFLNSHDYKQDPTGALLEGILMGPTVVGQWINAEHYFSATDPEVYGSGSKIYHNVVGRVGIMSGPQSDLRTGLAWQSVASGDLTYHEPVRLLVVVEAPQQRIQDIIDRQPALKQLCDNEWIHLVAINHEHDEKFYHYSATEGWVSINSITVTES